MATSFLPQFSKPWKFYLQLRGPSGFPSWKPPGGVPSFPCHGWRQPWPALLRFVLSPFLDLKSRASPPGPQDRLWK